MIRLVSAFVVRKPLKTRFLVRTIYIYPCPAEKMENFRNLAVDMTFISSSEVEIHNFTSQGHIYIVIYKRVKQFGCRYGGLLSLICVQFAINHKNYHLSVCPRRYEKVFPFTS